MNFSQALENAGVPVTAAELLLGHRRQSMSYGTYLQGPEFKVLQEAIKTVKYSLDLGTPHCGLSDSKR